MGDLGDSCRPQRGTATRTWSSVTEMRWLVLCCVVSMRDNTARRDANFLNTEKRSALHDIRNSRWLQSLH